MRHNTRPLANQIARIYSTYITTVVNGCYSKIQDFDRLAFVLTSEEPSLLSF